MASRSGQGRLSNESDGTVSGKLSSSTTAKYPKLKSPAELIAAHSAKGLDDRAAAVAVIEDLQRAVNFYSRDAISSRRALAEEKAKVDSWERRLVCLEATVAEKPGMGGVFIAGVSASAAVRAFADFAPKLVGGLISFNLKINEMIAGRVQ
eukprot:TRINITY_DN581_c0_g1_i2.p1 TRINITY_DN581_c0_g1~~TRINITY_DN581_c0_g1_i2.p1  ORF type:complete len:151 (+),score=21.53 TRINITY_DN581_c0_g1_i2:36-488(+)